MWRFTPEFPKFALDRMSSVRVPMVPDRIEQLDGLRGVRAPVPAHNGSRPGTAAALDGLKANEEPPVRQ